MDLIPSFLFRNILKILILKSLVGCTKWIASEINFCSNYWFLWFSFLALNFFMFWNFVLQFTFEWNVSVLVSMSSHLSPESPFPRPSIQGFLLLIFGILADKVMEPEGGLTLFWYWGSVFVAYLLRPSFLIQSHSSSQRFWLQPALALSRESIWVPCFSRPLLVPFAPKETTVLHPSSPQPAFSSRNQQVRSCSAFLNIYTVSVAQRCFLLDLSYVFDFLSLCLICFYSFVLCGADRVSELAYSVNPEVLLIVKLS